MTTLEVLKKARAHIKRGWCQRHNYVDGKGKPCFRYDSALAACCASGALYLADDGWGFSAWEKLVESMDYPSSIADWNDAPGRTQDEVLALFDSAIAKCEATA